MLGWNVSVYRQQDNRATPAAMASVQGARIAMWHTGLGGLGWVDALVTEGHALMLRDGGYPRAYTATARYVVPRLVGNPLDAHESVVRTDALDAKWALVRDVAAACSPEEWLIIEAWDES